MSQFLSAERPCEQLERPLIITMSQSAFESLVTDLAQPEVRPVTPLAAEAIAEHAASLREYGRVTL